MIALQPPVDAQSLELRIRERGARIEALTAEQARDLVLFDELGEWRGTGMRDCADWVSCNLGHNLQNARALMTAGHAAGGLPEIGGAFVAGECARAREGEVRAGAPVP